ncbi:Csu type fimbrial protein [Dyella soli]|uniref:Spore coat U domain-containing protein n=1 Tax=Dyella soli TaxID=522319 RepID=A0A4R0YKG1_9GAMM|nr:spore coat U domain-containing protein [Dyella soli]TCI06484.1 spore coat U domain-containing protein [Dyella soli]
MSTGLMRYVLVLLLLGCGVFHATPARAAITCSATSMTPLSFGTVNPLASATVATSTLTYTCTNSSNSTQSATVCFSIGEPGGAQTNPRLMSSGTNKLQFQLWQDPAHTIVWGSQFFGSPTPLKVNLTLGNRATTGAVKVTLYGQVLDGQTGAVPGSYADNYLNADTAVSVNSVAGSTAPGACGSQDNTNFFPFNVTATVSKTCTVTANPVLDLGTVAAGAASTSGSNTLSVSCSNSTPFFVGLKPSNNNTGGQGVMKATATGNTDSVPYTLYSNSGLTTVWGNTATSTTVGNGVAGSGNGLSQTLTVYARTTSTDVTPDTYTDVVTVNVNY